MNIVIVFLFWWQVVSGHLQGLVPLDTAKLLFFFGPNFNDRGTFALQSAKDILLDNRFNNLRHTVLYIHGFKEKLEDENQHLIVDAYLKRNDHNILLVDWEQLAAGNYVTDAIPNALRLSDAVSNAVLMLLNNGLDINKLHIVSHSLGSHLAGLIGRQIHKKSSNIYKIKRITCLDPAFPLFYPAFFYKGISKSDAEFIDVIHVDSWIYGTPFSVGNADFYPNGGTTLQPGCPPRELFSQTLNDFCSHHRSIRFWAESVANINTKLYSSKQCISYTMFKLGRCRENEVVNMGIDCSPKARGNFFVRTNDKSPFAKELSGPLMKSYRRNYYGVNSIGT